MPIESETIKKSALAPTVLVAGGAGFIGSHLVEALLLKGCKVVVLDNFSTGKRSYLNNALENPKFTLIECDINNGIPKNVETVDYIFHLAGTEPHTYSQTNVSLSSLLTSAVGTKNLLELAQKSSAKFLLGSSLDIYEGISQSFDLNYYFGQTEKEERMFSHSEAKRFAEALVWEYRKNHQVDARIVRLPEVFGPRMDFESGSEIGRLVKLLLDRQDLTVFGEGTENTYYLYITDAVAGLIKAEFGEETDGKIYTLINNDPVTTLEVTYLVKALSNSQTHVIFKNPTSKARSSTPVLTHCDSCDLLKWAPKVNLRDGLIKLLKWHGYQFNNQTFKPNLFLSKEKTPERAVTSVKPESLPSPLEPPKKTEASKRKPRKVSLLPLLGSGLALTISILFFAVIPVIQVAAFSRSGYSRLNEAQTKAINLDLAGAKEAGSLAISDFGKAESSLKNVGWVFLITRQESRLRTYAKALKVADYAASAITNASIGAMPLASLWDGIRPNSAAIMDKNVITTANLNFKSAKEDLLRAQAELMEMDASLLPAGMGEKLKTASDKIPQTLETLSVAQSTAEALPDLLGVDGNKKYLVLFQNPNELRATGGFIGSYAVVSFIGGKIKEVTIDDVYNVDGLLDLNGYKEPAYAPISTNLKQNYLRIRDANWQASFPSSAATILKLFATANGTRFDGVVAVDMFLIKDLLKTTGPIFVTAYNENITSENVYERAQYYSEAQYEEGSQQKRAFLTVLGSKLLESMFELDNTKLSNLVAGLADNVGKKHILVYLPNSQLTSLIERQNWNGEVSDTKGDFIYIVDSNLGSNKANCFVKESASYEITNTYRDGSLEVNLTITYEHTGKDNSWPGGPYTDYLRVLVPPESFLHKAVSKLGANGEVDITKAVTTGTESGKRTFETQFKLNPTETLVLKFNYTLPSSLSLNRDQTVYNLTWQKQPGTEAMPVKIAFNEPFGKSVATTRPEFTKIDKVYSLSTTLEKDLKVAIDLR